MKTTVIAIRCNPRILAALDTFRQKLEIVPNQSQTALFMCCRGLGVPVDAPEDETISPPKPAAKKRSKTKNKT